MLLTVWKRSFAVTHRQHQPNRLVGNHRLPATASLSGVSLSFVVGPDRLAGDCRLHGCMQIGERIWARWRGTHASVTMTILVVCCLGGCQHQNQRRVARFQCGNLFVCLCIYLGGAQRAAMFVMTYKGVATSSSFKVMHGDLGTKVSKGRKCCSPNRPQTGVWLACFGACVKAKD